MSRKAIIAGAAAGLFAGFAAVYSFTRTESKPEPPPAETSAKSSDAAAAAFGAAVTRDLAKGAMAAFVVKKERETVAEAEFVNETGQAVNIGQWRGRVVLVNLWATWCGPCRKEMPDLAALQTLLGGPDFEVVAISVDRKGADAAAAFLIETNAVALKLYIDTSADVLDKFKAPGLPASVLIDRQGREIGRLVGPADWISPEAVALIKAAIAEGQGAKS